MPGWVKWAAGIFGLMVLIGIFNGNDDEQANDPPRGAVVTLTAAAETVDDDRYKEALEMAEQLPAGQEERIRLKISRRLAERATNAVRADRLSRARSLLRQAARYPATAQLRSARGRLRDAVERQRIGEQPIVPEPPATPVPESPAATPGPPPVPEGACGDIAATNFAVPPGDERDADGDGVACEE